MHMGKLERRLQVSLDELRYRKVRSEAQRRQVSVATVIRDAIDRLPADVDLPRTAIAEILAAEPMPLPAYPGELRQELDSAHEPRGERRAIAVE